MSAFELYPEGSARKIKEAEPFCWPATAGSTPTVSASVGAWLDELGPVSSTATDLVRLAAAAYMADRRSARGVGFSRTIQMHVQLINPTTWEPTVNDLANLLSWLTGDMWVIELSPEDVQRPEAEHEDGKPIDAIALLSGGLDSFCGAVVAGPSKRLFLGHWDNPIIKGSQNSVARWMRDAFDTAFHYEQIRITQGARKREPSSRSRSLLFMALAVAKAEVGGAQTVEIPENGFTSINPPLGPERGGALSTRSTHPTTISRFNAMVAAVGLNVTAAVPHGDLTKGQLVALAEGQGRPGFRDGVAATLSCGKLDGRTYKGGNPNHHCGLCYPCIVRRGGIQAAGLDDITPYLSETLTGAALAKLRRNRAPDIEAVRRAVASGFSEELLLSVGPFPEDHDLDQAAELCEAGLAELSHVLLD